MWTTVLVITLYNSVWCIHRHIRFMQHNFLFPKVASPSMCASLWRDVWHARVRWLCWQIFRTFQAWNTLWHLPRRSQDLYKMLPGNIFIFHLTQSFRPAMQGASYNLMESPTAKSLTSMLQQFKLAPQTQLSEEWLKTWKRFYSDGKCPLNGTWYQKSNCQSSYKWEITPEETDR